jgi:hypothetical protein
MIVAAAWALLIWLVILLAFGPEAFKAIAAKRRPREDLPATSVKQGRERASR